MAGTLAVTCTPSLCGVKCSIFSNVLRSRGMVIVLIAHSKVERFEDPESSPYDRYSPRLHKHAAALVKEWCDAVLFATRKMRTQSEDGGFNRKRTIAHAIGKDGGERVDACLRIAHLRGQEPLRHRRRIAALVVGFVASDEAGRDRSRSTVGPTNRSFPSHVFNNSRSQSPTQGLTNGKSQRL